MGIIGKKVLKQGQTQKKVQRHVWIPAYGPQSPLNRDKGHRNSGNQIGYGCGKGKICQQQHCAHASQAQTGAHPENTFFGLTAITKQGYPQQNQGKVSFHPHKTVIYSEDAP